MRSYPFDPADRPQRADDALELTGGMPPPDAVTQSNKF